MPTTVSQDASLQPANTAGNNDFYWDYVYVRLRPLRSILRVIFGVCTCIPLCTALVGLSLLFIAPSVASLKLIGVGVAVLGFLWLFISVVSLTTSFLTFPKVSFINIFFFLPSTLELFIYGLHLLIVGSFILFIFVFNIEARLPFIALPCVLAHLCWILSLRLIFLNTVRYRLKLWILFCFAIACTFLFLSFKISTTSVRRDATYDAFVQYRIHKRIMAFSAMMYALMFGLIGANFVCMLLHNVEALKNEFSLEECYSFDIRLIAAISTAPFLVTRANKSTSFLKRDFSPQTSKSALLPKHMTYITKSLGYSMEMPYHMALLFDPRVTSQGACEECSALQSTSRANEELATFFKSHRKRSGWDLVRTRLRSVTRYISCLLPFLGALGAACLGICLLNAASVLNTSQHSVTILLTSTLRSLTLLDNRVVNMWSPLGLTSYSEGVHDLHPSRVSSENTKKPWDQQDTLSFHAPNTLRSPVRKRRSTDRSFRTAQLARVDSLLQPSPYNGINVPEDVLQPSPYNGINVPEEHGFKIMTTSFLLKPLPMVYTLGLFLVTMAFLHTFGSWIEYVCFAPMSLLNRNTMEAMKWPDYDLRCHTFCMTPDERRKAHDLVKRVYPKIARSYPNFQGCCTTVVPYPSDVHNDTLDVHNDVLDVHNDVLDVHSDVLDVHSDASTPSRL